MMNGEIERYYEEHGKKVYLYLMTLCGDNDTAEELTQETFYQAIKNLKTYKGQSSVYTWLCGIAKNLWFCELRRRKKHSHSELDETIADLSPPPDEAYMAQYENIAMLKRIHELPETEKELILLRASAGLSFREIGEIFGWTETRARVTYYRVKQKLKKE